MKPTLKPEVGVTSISLKNAAELRKTAGRTTVIRLLFANPSDADEAEAFVVADYEDGTQHQFSGFAWGYGGRGPSGLREFLDAEEVDPIKLSELPSHGEVGSVAHWHRGHGWSERHEAEG